MGSRKVIYVIVIFLLVISILSVPVVVGEENDKHKVITEEEFHTKLEKGDYNFSWCKFPFKVDLSGFTLTDADFSNAIFEKGANFNKVTFEGETNFIGTDFGDNADFSAAIFKSSTIFYKANFLGADFGGATFKGSVWFYDTYFEKSENFLTANFLIATFEKDAHFKEATFEGVAHFSGAIFKKYANFKKVKFLDEANFTTTTFEYMFDLSPEENQLLDFRYIDVCRRGLIRADVTNALFYNAYIENINFYNCEWPETIFEELNPNYFPMELTNKDLEEIYRNLKRDFQAHGDQENAGWAFYREMEMKRFRAIKEGNWKQRLWLCVLKKSCGYGEKPQNVIFCSLAIIVFFAFLFYFTDLEIKNYIKHRKFHKILGILFKFSLSMKDRLNYFTFCFFFSMSSFTTLGSSYVKSKGKWTHRGSALESLIGAFFIALFIYVFARKMLR